MDSANLHPTAASRVTGELVLQNGHKAGTRQPLNTPATFIGREQGCDVRLNVDGIDPLHCLLITGVDGVRIRDLNSAHGTFVNGVRTHHLQLHNGDLLTVGPFQFRVEITTIPATDDPERDALRIQIAAVAAQQAALDDEEARLQKRKADLEQQEEQLAAHLAAKQRQIEIGNEQLDEEREALRITKLEHQVAAEKADAELTQTRESLAKDHRHLTVERQRVNTVYQRLRQRWQKHWGIEREKYQRLTQEVLVERRDLQHKLALWREREASFGQNVLHFNTERELTVRQLHDERSELKKDQESWRKRRSLELAALHARQADLDDAHAKLTQARHLVAQEKAAWQRQQETLEKELHGLNNRIVHQRMRIQEQADELARLEAQRRSLTKTEAANAIPQAIILESDVEVVGTEPAAASRIIGLEQLASDLADQRVALAEQYERIVHIHRAWHEERTRAADDLDAFAQRLATEEQDIAARQMQTRSEETSLGVRRAEIENMRQEIAIFRAQLTSRAHALEEEHAAELAALREKGALLEEQLASLAEVRVRWNNRRQEEIAHWQASHALLAQELAQTHSQRTELFAAGQQVAAERRSLVEKSLALEQYRQEVFLRAKDPAAQRRVERLRRRWLSLHAALVRYAKKEREGAEMDLERIEKGHALLQEQRDRLTHVEAALTEKQTHLDEREALLHAQRVHLDDELRKLTHQKQAPARHNLLLHEDAEAVAHVIFEEPAPPPIDRAA